MREIKSLLIVLLLMIFLLISCARREATGFTAAISPTKVEKSDLVAAPTSWQEEWEKVLSEARKEGSMVYYGSLAGDTRNALVAEFQKKFGIRMESFAGRSAEVIAKLFSERKAGLYLADIYMGGESEYILSLKTQKALSPIEPMFLLPELTDPDSIRKTWWAGTLSFSDRDRLVLKFLAYPYLPLAINTKLIKSEEIKSYNDLLNPKWKGKIILDDPTVSGPSNRFLAFAAWYIMTIDWLRQLAQQEPIIMRDKRLEIEWLSQGKYPIALCPWSDALADFMKAGAPLEIYSPVEGTYIASGTGNVALIDRPAHPNAAKLFINWMLSKEGQIVFTRNILKPSGRLDVPTDFLDPSTLRKPGVKYYEAGEEFTLRVEEMAKLHKETFGHLIK